MKSFLPLSEAADPTLAWRIQETQVPAIGLSEAEISGAENCMKPV